MNSNHKKTREGSFLFQVTEEAELLPFLLENLKKNSRNSIKSMLTRGQVSVNGQTITKHNHKLLEGQKVEILHNKAAKSESSLTGLSIIYEDESIIVIDKEAGLLSMAAKDKNEKTAFSEVSSYVKKQNPRQRVFIVHRLDRDTSGVLLFAKSEKVKMQLQDNWDELVKDRIYAALVQGNVKKEKDTIKSYLKETRTYKVYSNPTDNGGQLAITHYRKIRAGRQYSLLEVRLETGRKNQIRVHMEEIGHPVVGDKKYGSTVNPIKRLGLHATALTIVHPITNEIMKYESEIPSSFINKSL
ncbi:RluA family pseudouridine synthase [Sporosarcina highlanderae]|uniref:Pseudouridine synthase n=1 Tax=Sporosarcina highlanderae TaxID=3035916 RepID=A0ABT8JPF6_9BACL|nr:RluA family pseudouridine synthase [Sporosarcina highlanderae]MDN4606912.1 RluA family pseudouridine synthase [Sporosarcina highlanderae]